MSTKGPKPVWQLKSFMRKRSAEALGLSARLLFCHLSQQQPLLLRREPDNPADPNAVLVTDVLGEPCGYVAREHAAEVSSRLQREMLLARTSGPCLCIARSILIWSEGEEVEKDIYATAPPQDADGERQRQKAPIRVPEKA